jgi:hypothetical protein
MIVGGCYGVWGKPKSTDHQVLTNDHLALDTVFKVFDRDFGPIGV